MEVTHLLQKSLISYGNHSSLGEVTSNYESHFQLWKSPPTEVTNYESHHYRSQF